MSTDVSTIAVAASDLTKLAQRINAAHSKIQQAMKAGLEHAIEAGLLLIEAKAAVGHGEWLPWLDQNCTVSPRTAQAYMRVARHVPKLEDKSAAVADLTLREALSQMASRAIEIAKLPAPAATKALEEAEEIPLRAAVGRAVTHERSMEEQRQQVAHLVEQGATFIRRGDWQGAPLIECIAPPRAKPEPTPEEIERARLVQCAMRWIERALAKACEHNSALSQDIILTALNEVYCAIQGQSTGECRGSAA